MKSRYSGAQGVINSLSNEGMYEFTLTGEFEDVIGQYADIQWKTEPLTGKRSVLEKLLSTDDALQSPSNENPPRLHPSPPQVTIETGKANENEPKVKNIM